MQNVRLLAVILVLPGCATRSIPEPTFPPFGWVRWEPTPLNLLGSVEEYPVVRQSVASKAGREVAVFTAPKPVPALTRPPPPPPAPANPPGRRRNPAIEYVASGTTLKLAASADGAQPFSFEWRKDGQPIAGETQAMLTIEKVSPADTGVYECIVSNAAGAQASQPIKVIVRAR